MSLDRIKAAHQGPHQLKLGDTVELYTHDTVTFDLSDLLAQSMVPGNEDLLKVHVNIGKQGSGNSFEIVIFNGEASVVETNGEFDDVAESVSHVIYVLNSNRSFDLRPKLTAMQKGMDLNVEVRTEKLLLGGWRQHYEDLLSQKQSVRSARSNFRKGCLAALGGFALATAACGGMAYEALSEDQVEEVQNAD